MVQTKTSLVSILGSSYFQPIADLLNKWPKSLPHRSNAVQSSSVEHGYASSVILLLVAMFESYVVRVRYVQRHAVPASSRTAIDVLLHLYPRLRHHKALADVYVVRDAVFHNHLWEIEYFQRDAPGMVFCGARRDPAFGDKKYTSRVNSNTRRTKALRIHVVPTRLDRRDAKKAFDTIWKTLLFLEAKNRNQCYVSHLRVRFQNNFVLFGELSGYLKSHL